MSADRSRKRALNFGTSADLVNVFGITQLGIPKLAISFLETYNIVSS
jgi:hypothetical protein